VLLVHRNTINFYIIFLSCNFFPPVVLGIEPRASYMLGKHSALNYTPSSTLQFLIINFFCKFLYKWSCHLQIWLFFLHVTLARTSSRMLKSSRESIRACLSLDLSMQTFSLLPLNRMITEVFCFVLFCLFFQSMPFVRLTKFS
jgi:hypothetical protein